MRNPGSEYVPEETIPAGTEGTVVSVDGLGTLHVEWDNGSKLGLIPGHDSYEVLP